MRSSKTFKAVITTVLAVLIALALFLRGRTVSQAGVVINEVLVSNAFSILDDDRHSTDWVELVNIGSRPLNLGGFGLSDDVGQPKKWVFPDTTLAPGQTLLVWCSGKNRIAQPAPVSPAKNAENLSASFDPHLVSRHARWRTLSATPLDELPPRWKLRAFDDRTWKTWAPEVDSPLDYKVSFVPAASGPAYFRHVFRVEPGDNLDQLSLQVGFSAGFSAYLNGVRVTVAEEPQPAIEPRAAPRQPERPVRRHQIRTWERFDLTPRAYLLTPGENVLAIEVERKSSDESTLFLVPELGAARPVLHANFRLRSREILFLSKPDGEVQDAVILPPQTGDRSYGRFPDGTGDFRYYLSPSPRETNHGPVSGQPIANRPLFEPQGGEYSEPLRVEISLNLPMRRAQIRYTLTGAKPTHESLLYDAPIDLPEGALAGTVIRAAGFAVEEQITQVETQSYFFDTATLERPLLSIAMRPVDFRDVHLIPGGRGRDAEREGHVEFLDADGKRVAASGMGLRLHGGETGRTGNLSTKKAYRMYFRNEYGGKKLRFPVIPTSRVDVYDKLVLRINLNDSIRSGGKGSYIRDSVIRALQHDMGDLAVQGTWYNLFVNMKYRGLFNVVERLDAVLLGSYFPEEGENWDVIKFDGALDGDLAAWNAAYEFFDSADLRDEAQYQRARNLVDIDNYTRYMILNIWAQNHDWPQRNFIAARPRRPEGKWVFFVWDSEYGLGRMPEGFSADSFERAFGIRHNLISRKFVALMESEHYQRYFLEEVSRQLEGALHPYNVLAHIRRHRDLIAPDMVDDLHRNFPDNDTQLWRDSVRDLEVFAEQRDAVFRRMIFGSDRFSVSTDERKH